MKNQNQETAEVTAETITATFNPLALLTEEQRKAIGTRFNKTWITPRMSAIGTLQLEHNVDFFTAAFTLSMLEDANNLVSSKKIAKVADTMMELSGELFGTEANKEAAILQIETAFDRLDTIQQPQAGKRFRQLVTKGYTVAMAQRILIQVCEKLGVREAEWL